MRLIWQPMLNIFSDVNLSNKLVLEKQLRNSNMMTSSFNSSPNDDSYQRHGDRVTHLGLNIYANTTFTTDIYVQLIQTETIVGFNDTLDIDFESMRNI